MARRPVLTWFSRVVLTFFLLGFLVLVLCIAVLTLQAVGVEFNCAAGGDGEASGVGHAAAPSASGSVGGGVAQPRGKALGSKKNPLKVSIVSFHGYAPALLANGKSLKTQPGSLFEQHGVNVEFILQDDIPPLATIYESGTAHCAWRTSDFWAQEQPNLRLQGLDARAIVVVDNTQGADAIITRDPSIRSVEDLAGHSIALLQYTPSDGMVIDAVDASSLSQRKKQSIDYVYINVEEGTPGVRAAFEAGHVDAAALWDPDLSLALRHVDGASVIYSTATATNLIYDVMVCDSRYLDDPANEAVFQSFVAGWMAGVPVARAQPDEAVDALRKTEEFFDLLAKEEGDEFIKGLFDTLVWTGLEENALALGLTGGPNHYERVYRRFDGIYRRAGALSDPAAPVITPQDSFDYRFIKKLLDENPQALTGAQSLGESFSIEERDQLDPSAGVLTKPVMVSFGTNQSDLDGDARDLIDTEMVPLIENNGSAYFVVSGNTDSTGSRRRNMQLSDARAIAVVDYLVTEWEFARERFIIQGNGPDQPLCDEARPDEEGMTLDECRAANRTTRLAVLARD